MNKLYYKFSIDPSCRLYPIKNNFPQFESSSSPRRPLAERGKQISIKITGISAIVETLLSPSQTYSASRLTSLAHR